MLGLDLDIAEAPLDDGELATPLEAAAVPPRAGDEAVARILDLTGIPTIEGAATPEEEAIELLRIAAGVEHALLVQYLYAASSLRSMSDPLARKIRTIAEQEMAHFATVQNLLVLLGIEPFLGRRDSGQSSELDPIPFHLEPLDRASLAKYVALEMPSPDRVEPGLREEVNRIVAEAKLDARGDVHRVGAIYVKIYWLLQESDRPEGPLALGPELGLRPGWHVGALRPREAVAPYQTDEAEWPGSVPNFYVDTAGDRAEALRALYRIMAQGEGLVDADDSHFYAFLGAFRAFDGAADRVLPLPEDPDVSPEPRPDPARERNRITHPLARAWAELFDVRYHLLLLCIGLSLATPRSDARRATYLRWSMDEMRRGVGRVAQRLVQLPRKEGGARDGDRAAPAWRAPAALPAGTSERLRLLHELTARSAVLLARLEGGEQEASARALIITLKALDEARRSAPELAHDPGLA
ncbi:ferritin-like domain-containing protein [Sorangium sp. So ce1182]|uniref:ferritin-like domain-containing protein n=1 Tax=Sorangium sp. So ce1182 TaxID=3133334 RepID=UPI003F5FEE12